VTTRCRYCTVR